MASILKSTGNGESDIDVQPIMSELASLREDIAALTKHVIGNTYDASSAAASQMGAEATKVYNNMAAQGQRSAKLIGQQVEQQPLTTLLIAFALGFVDSRMMSR